VCCSGVEIIIIAAEIESDGESRKTVEGEYVVLIIILLGIMFDTMIDAIAVYYIIIIIII